MSAPPWYPNFLLIQWMLTDCALQAEDAKNTLEEVLDCLRDGNHLGALGASRGLGDTVLYVSVVLERLATLTGGEEVEQTN